MVEKVSYATKNAKRRHGISFGISWYEGDLEYVIKGRGQQSIVRNNKYGYPQISDDENVEYTVEKGEEYSIIKVTTTSMALVKITAQNIRYNK